MILQIRNVVIIHWTKEKKPVTKSTRKELSKKGVVIERSAVSVTKAKSIGCELDPLNGKI